MDFVEHIFGISPAAGASAGAYEALLLSLPFVAAVVLWLPRLIEQQSRKRQL